MGAGMGVGLRGARAGVRRAQGKSQVGMFASAVKNSKEQKGTNEAISADLANAQEDLEASAKTKKQKEKGRL